MRRRIVAISVLVIFAALLVTGSLAYFTAHGRAVNVITIGSVDIEIEEYDQNGKKFLTTKENDTTDISGMPDSFKNIEPGQRIVKQVVIKNWGDNPAWVRAKIIDTITPQNGSGTLSDAVLSYNVNQLYSNNTTLKEPTQNGTWEKDGDYWYFSEPLEPGETAILFNVVTFDGPSMGNEYQGCNVEIKVIAQAVQSKNNGNRDPALWPAEPSLVNGGEQS